MNLKEQISKNLEELTEELDIVTRKDLYLAMKETESNVISEIKMTIYKVASLIIVAIFMLALFI